MRQATIIRGEISLSLPIKCDSCGQLGWSNPIQIDIASTSVYEAGEYLKQIKQVGTAFPVGWGRYYHPSGDKLKCSYCN